MRYKITTPIENGYNWFRIVDTESDVMPNFDVAQVYIGVPDAETLAKAVCYVLNVSIRE